jgi:hypothetical protein
MNTGIPDLFVKMNEFYIGGCQMAVRGEESKLD